MKLVQQISHKERILLICNFMLVNIAFWKWKVFFVLHICVLYIKKKTTVYASLIIYFIYIFWKGTLIENFSSSLFVKGTFIFYVWLKYKCCVDKRFDFKITILIEDYVHTNKSLWKLTAINITKNCCFHRFTELEYSHYTSYVEIGILHWESVCFLQTFIWLHKD